MLIFFFYQLTCFKVLYSGSVTSTLNNNHFREFWNLIEHLSKYVRMKNGFSHSFQMEVWNDYFFCATLFSLFLVVVFKWYSSNTRFSDRDWVNSFYASSTSIKALWCFIINKHSPRHNKGSCSWTEVICSGINAGEVINQIISVVKRIDVFYYCKYS